MPVGVSTCTINMLTEMPSAYSFTHSRDTFSTKSLVSLFRRWSLSRRIGPSQRL